MLSESNWTERSAFPAATEVAFEADRYGWRERANARAGQESLELLELIAPRLNAHASRLRRRLDELADRFDVPPFDCDALERSLVELLEPELLWMIGRVGALELSVARLEGVLTGDTAAERYRSFIERLATDEAVRGAILDEYPVLASEVERCLAAWVSTSCEMLERLCNDRREVEEHFSRGRPLGPVSSITYAGDAHRGGRRVAVISFASGTRVVYKPRALTIEGHFHALLQWIDATFPRDAAEAMGLGDASVFRTFRTLDRGAYGWAEFVETRPCSTLPELKRFYARSGACLAVFYALEATDFHYENVIASGEYPIAVDLESLFHGVWDELVADDAEKAAGLRIAHSVLRVGLLPQRIFGAGDSEGVELSGLGGQSGQLTPRPVPRWRAMGTDEMTLVRERIALPGAQNRPMIDGRSADPLRFEGDVAAGFEAMYRHLMANRDRLLAPDGPVALFSDDEVRVIVRATRDYSLILRESYHPDLLRIAAARGRHFDKLRLAVKRSPGLGRVVDAEIEALQRGDVPMFATTPVSRHLRTDAGGKIEAFLDEPGMDRSRGRIAALSERDLDAQLWFVHAAFTSLVSGDGSRDGVVAIMPRVSKTDATLAPTRDAFVDAARNVGDRLCALAVTGADDASFVGVEYGGARHWEVAPLGVDLYGGLPGVALFLAQLAAVTKDDRYTALARGTLRTLERQVERTVTSRVSVGAFAGIGGVIYAASHVASLTGERSLMASVPEAIARLVGAIEYDRAFDVIDGAAGAILSLLAAHRVLKETDVAIDAARACGHHLLAHAVPVGDALAWTPSHTKRPLAGFAHGASGIGSALYALAEATGETLFRTAARRAFSFEASLYSPDEQNWPDVSKLDPEDDPAPGCTTAWCHGAPGVGLGRLVAIASGESAESVLADHLQTAIATTQRRGFGSNHSLCHGDLGNLELLARANAIAPSDALAEMVALRGGQLLASIRQHGYLCGVPTRTETPGLMTGLSGIGHGLLRMAAPELVASVLTLDAPR